MELAALKPDPLRDLLLDRLDRQPEQPRGQLRPDDLVGFNKQHLCAVRVRREIVHLASRSASQVSRRSLKAESLSSSRRSSAARGYAGVTLPGAVAGGR